MPAILDEAVAAVTDALLRVFRLPVLNRTGVYAILGAPFAQPILARIARRRAVAAFHRAVKRCPAYARFIEQQGFSARVTFGTFASVPATTKRNYVKAFSIEDRCFDGEIPARGVVIDESSGSSGAPNNWVRGPAERAGVRRMLRHGMNLLYSGERLFLINCFALGPWATGMNVSMSLANEVIVKSVGPDRQKFENTLRTFGERYTYIVTGYPPFIRDFLGNTTLDLSPYRMHLITGGEGISEGLRDRFLQVFQSAFSSYGASDLEINLAAESPMSVAVRRLCVKDARLCRALFGRDDPPMLFQYDPLDYLIETSPDHELIFTLVRHGYAAPKIRYELGDVGGVITHRRLLAVLREHGVDPARLPRSLAFPFLFVGGRADLTVPFYGAKIYTTDLDAVLTSEPELRERFNSFQLGTVHDAEHNETLEISLERSTASLEPIDGEELRRRLFEGLLRVNQDFREVSRMFTIDRLRLRVFDHGTGPFADRDIRVKHRYIAPDDSPRGT